MTQTGRHELSEINNTIVPFIISRREYYRRHHTPRDVYKEI
jgi:hypothetical protein